MKRFQTVTSKDIVDENPTSMKAYKSFWRPNALTEQSYFSDSDQIDTLCNTPELQFTFTFDGKDPRRMIFSYDLWFLWLTFMWQVKASTSVTEQMTRGVWRAWRQQTSFVNDSVRSSVSDFNQRRFYVVPAFKAEYFYSFTTAVDRSLISSTGSRIQGGLQTVKNAQRKRPITKLVERF